MNKEDELLATQNDIDNAATAEVAADEKPKKRRGRPSKAELEARKAAEALTDDNADTEGNTESPAQEETTADQPTVEAEAPKRRKRRTKAEIIEAAAAAAAALAQANQQKEEINNAMEEKADANNEPEETEPESIVPEEAYSSADIDTNDTDNELLDRLQQKINSANTSDSVWEGDPGDGTDFIIINDLPVEDSGSSLEFYDNFMAPCGNSREAQAADYEEEADNDDDNNDSEYEFEGIVTASGLLEVMPDGYGFLRSSDYNYLPSPDDVHLTTQQVKMHFLKTGDVVECNVRPPHGSERYFTMTSLLKVNGRDPGDICDRISFENLTPLFPDTKFNLCGEPHTTNQSTRIVDIFTPLGKGQRSLIVAQPKTGKTMLMKDIANAIAANHPEAYIMMLLIDERPEEVTDMSRTVNAEVIASTFDEPAERHVKIASLVLEKAKRLVECGHDVVIFLDSITRLARAYNTVAPVSGKVLTGGVDANSLQKPKRFFGAARNIENGGSLTIIATALTDTGSKMDEVIFEEFKGTGNSELQLDRQLANKRIFPAINLVQSSTRRDDLLLDEDTINKMWVLRNSIADMNPTEAMTSLKTLLQRSRNIDELFAAMNS